MIKRLNNLGFECLMHSSNFELCQNINFDGKKYEFVAQIKKTMDNDIVDKNIDDKIDNTDAENSKIDNVEGKILILMLKIVK